MLRGNTNLSSAELAACFVVVGAGFAEAGSEVPRYVRELLLDEDEGTGLSTVQRLHLLEWATALTALPCGGLGENPITVVLWVGRDASDLPMVHTCSREVHMPPYTSRMELRAKLLLAVEHRQDGFHTE